jgi:hypothetical protein
MRIRRNGERTWERGGEQATKEMKIQECQIFAMPLITLLVLLDTHWL